MGSVQRLDRQRQFSPMTVRSRNNMRTVISLRPFRRVASALVVLLLGTALSPASLALTGAQSADLKAHVLDDSGDIAQAAVDESIKTHDIVALRTALESRYIGIELQAAKALGRLGDRSAVPDLADA